MRSVVSSHEAQTAHPRAPMQWLLAVGCPVGMAVYVRNRRAELPICRWTGCRFARPTSPRRARIQRSVRRGFMNASRVMSCESCRRSRRSSKRLPGHRGRFQGHPKRRLEPTCVPTPYPARGRTTYLDPARRPNSGPAHAPREAFEPEDWEQLNRLRSRPKRTHARNNRLGSLPSMTSDFSDRLRAPQMSRNCRIA